MPISNDDYVNADLYDGLNQRPSSAVPLELPDISRLEQLNTNKQPRNSPGELWQKQQEQQARNQRLENQRQAQQAREAEIIQKEQAQREALRNRVPTDQAQQKPPTVDSRNYESRYKQIPVEAGEPLGQKPVSTPSNGTPKPTATEVQIKQQGGQVIYDEPPPPAKPPAELPTPQKVGNPGIPAGMPLPKGAAIGGGVTAVVDFGGRVANGQPLEQAAGGAVATGAFSVAGGIIGGFIGSAVPVVGTTAGYGIGSIIGGYFGGALADFFWYQNFPPGVAPPADPILAYPFKGGQLPNMAYRVVATYDLFLNGQFHSTQSNVFGNYIAGIVLGVYLGNPVPGRSAPGLYVIFQRANGTIIQQDISILVF
jgi:hypothetical protein